MKTYTTDEMLIVLSKIDFDITFLLEENRDIYVFNDIYRNICKFTYHIVNIKLFNSFIIFLKSLIFTYHIVNIKLN